MKEEGFEQGLRDAEWTEGNKRLRAWLGIKWTSEQGEQDEHV